MKPKTYWALGVLAVVMIIGACYLITKPSVPETITYKGETFTLQEFYTSAFDYNKDWEERLPRVRHLIAEAPNSINAYYARYSLATHDENGKSIYDNVVLFERLKPMLKYHPKSSGLLHDLLRYGMDIDPEAAIRYGKKALKYVDVGAKHTHYNADPARIHHYLALAYQIVGDYDAALEHFRKAKKLYLANIRTRGYSNYFDFVKQHIKAIEEGKPIDGIPLPTRAPKTMKPERRPRVPTLLTATAGSVPGHVELAWNAPSGNEDVTDYHFMYWKYENGIISESDWIPIDSTNTSYKVTGLKSGETYYFTVIATNSFGNSDESKPAWISVP